MNLNPGTRLSRYRLEETIGQGGMGVVWRATDTSLDREVAIKVLPADFAANAEKVARFRREAKLLASLNHPNIATIHEISEDAGVLFIAMEMVEGQTLRRVIGKQPLAIPDALAIGSEIAEALAYAHAHQVIHRDLKPENVIVRPDGHPKVLDFGLARHLGFLAEGQAGGGSGAATVRERMTEEGSVVGTVNYMSPEQARGEDLDHRSDIFAFGILLYEMLAGRPAFDGKSKIDILAAILEREPPPLAELAPGLPDEVTSVVKRCLEKSAGDRFATTEELSREMLRLHRDSDSIPTLAMPAATSSGEAVAGDSSRPAGRPVEINPARRFRYPHHLLVVLAVAAALVAGFFLMPSVLNPPVDPPMDAVSPGEPTRSGEGPEGGPAPSAGRRIVILPFENLGAAEDEYFAAGMADEITTRLAGVGGLQVIATSSASGYAGRQVSLETIREELGVDYVLEGKIHWASSGGGQVRVTPKLVDARDGAVVWAGIYNESTEDIFSVQSGIAGTVIDHLGIVLGAGERRAVEAVPTSSLEAYEAYLAGRYERARTDYSQEGRQRVVVHFQKAVALDPGFALAWVELSRGHAFMFHMGYDRSTARKELTLAAAERARELSPELPETHLGLGYYYYHVLRDYPAAVREFTLAREGLPGSVDVLLALGYLERRRGNFEESAEFMSRAAELSPRASGLHSQLGNTLIMMGRSEEAESALRQSISLAPEQSYPYIMLSRLARRHGDLAEARIVLDSFPGPVDPPMRYALYFQALMEDDPAAALKWVGSGSPAVIEWGHFYYPKELLAGYARRILGEEEEARRLLASALVILRREMVTSPNDGRRRAALGLVLVLLGQKEEGLREARAAADLIPIATDAYTGPVVLQELAWTYVVAGESGPALEVLRQMAGLASDLPTGVMDRDPRWAPLRGEPGFEALVAKIRSGLTAD